MKRLRILVFCLSLVWINFCLPPAYALSVDCITTLSFGRIIADPSQGETIEVDARFGAAQAVKTSTGVSVIQDAGHNGVIRVSSGTAFSCSLFFPGGIILNSGSDNMSVDNFSMLSETSGSSSGGVVDLTVGGRLKIQRRQAQGNYSGSGIVMVNIE